MGHHGKLYDIIYLRRDLNNGVHWNATTRWQSESIVRVRNVNAFVQRPQHAGRCTAHFEGESSIMW